MLTYMQIVIGLWLIVGSVITGFWIFSEHKRKRRIEKRRKELLLAHRARMDILESIRQARIQNAREMATTWKTRR